MLVVEGAYEGKNIYVQNPYTSKGDSFCVSKVLVNGKEIGLEPATAFEINLDSMNLKMGDPVKLEIVHKNNCKPKIIYNYDHYPKVTYTLASINLDSTGNLTWTTIKEKGKLPFVVEQFIWNKWIKVGEVDGKGGNDTNKYYFKAFLISGENRLRIKQVDNKGSHPSKPVIYISKKKQVVMKTHHISKTMELSDETFYEIYDQYGNIVKKGFGKSIDCSSLLRGVYYFNFDSTMSEFIIY